MEEWVQLSVGEGGNVQRTRISAARAQELIAADRGGLVERVSAENAAEFNAQFDHQSEVQRRTRVIEEELTPAERAVGLVGTTGLGFANELSFGGANALLTDDERLTQEAASQASGFGAADLVGRAAGVLAPAGIVGAATVGEAGLAAALPAGLSQAAGNSAERFFARALTQRLGARGAQAAGTAAGLVVDGGVGGMMDAVTQANIDGSPLTAESIVGGGLFGAALGLGAGGLLHAAGSGVNRLRGRALNQGLALQASGLSSSESRLMPDGSVRLGPDAIANDSVLGNALTDTPFRAISPVGDPTNQARLGRVAANWDDAVDTNVLSRMAPEVADSLDRTVQRSAALVNGLRSAEQRAATRNLSSQASVAARESSDLVQSLSGEINRRLALAGDAAGGSIAAQRFSDALAGVNAESPHQLAGQLDHALDVFREQGISLTDATDLGTTLSQARAQTAAALTQLDGGFTVDALGHIDRFDTSMSDLVSRRIATVDGRTGVTRIRDTKVFGAASTEGNDFRMSDDITTPLSEHLAETRALRDFLNDDVSDLEHAANSFGTLQTRAQLRSDYLTLFQNERQGSGLLSSLGLSGLGLGSATGAAVGGPLGAVAGGLVGGVVGAGFSLLTHPVSAIRRIRQLGDLVGAGRARVAASTDRLRTRLSGGARLAGSSLARGAKLTSRQVPRLANRLRSRESRDEEYREMRGQIHELLGDPQKLEEWVAMSTGPLMADGHEELATNYANTLVQGLMHLSEHIPPPNQSLWARYQREVPRSRSETDAFVRRYEAVEDPYMLLDLASELTLTADHVDAVRTVYPAIYAEMQASIVEILGDLDEPPPYPLRMQIGTLLDLPTDPSLEPDFIFKLQQTYAQTPQQHRAQHTSGRASVSTSERVSNAQTTTSQSLEINL